MAYPSPRRLQLRRGNAAAIASYLGYAGELVVDTSAWTLYVHDGVTVGGYAVTVNTAVITAQITSVNANITIANVGMKGYVDQGNSIQAAAITSSNIGMRGYVDATIAANIANIAVASTYSNVNVRTYLGSFDGNIVPSANVTYSLGSPTQQWKDLYVSNNTIYLGGTPLSSTPGGLTFAGVPVSSFAPTAATTVTPGTVWNYGNTGRAVGLTSGSLYQAAYGAGKFIIVENTLYGGEYFANTGLYSSDGVTWSTMYMPNVAAGTSRGATIYGGDKFVSMYVGHGNIATSTDGINWTFNQNAIPPYGVYGYEFYKGLLAYGNGRFVALSGYTTRRSVISTDGITWSNGAMSLGSVDDLPQTDRQGQSLFYKSLAFTDGVFVASATRVNGSGGNLFAYSTDGVSWGNIQLPVVASASTGYTLGAGGGVFIGVRSTTSNVGIRSTDGGRTWSNISLPNNTSASETGVVYGGGAFILITIENLSNIAISTDTGLTWSYAAIPPNLYYGGGAYGAGTFIAAGQWLGNVLSVVSYSNSVGTLTLAPTLPGTIDRVDIGVSTPGSGSFTSLSTSGDISTTGDISTSGDISTTGDISAGNVSLSDARGNTTVTIDSYTGNISTTGDISAGNVSLSDARGNTTVTIDSYTGNISAGNVDVYTVTTDNIDTSNITTPGGNLTISSSTIVTGNVTANYFVGNGSQLSALPGYAYSNVNVAAYVTTANSAIVGYVDQANTIQSQQISAANVGMRGYVDSQTFYSNALVATYLQSGNIANVSVAGNVTATYFVGNGALLTGIAASSNYSNVQTAAYLATATINTTGNITAGNLFTSGALYVANITTTGASGNISGANYITANYFVGNGALLTGLSSSYSNVQVATYLPTYTGVVTASNVAVNGNVTAQYLFGNGSQLTGIVASGSSYSNVEVATYLQSGNIANVSVAGNVTATYFVGNGALLTGIVGGASNYGNVDVRNFLKTGDGASRLIQGYYANIDLGATARLFSFGATAKSYFGHDGQLGNASINWVRADNGDVRIATNNGAYNWIFDNTGNLTLPGATAGETIATSGGYITVGNLLIGQGGSLFNSNNDSWALYGNRSDAGTSITIPSNDSAGNGQPIRIDNQISNVEIVSGNNTWAFSTDGNLTLPGNVAAINYANGVSILTGLGGSGTNYSNVNVQAYTETMGFKNYSNVNVAAYLSTATINTTGNITAANFVGNISITGNVTGTSSNVTLQAGAYTSVFDNQGNVTVPRLFTAGNIQTAGYLFGNGALLTGIVAGSSYGNIDVANYLGNVSQLRIGKEGLVFSNISLGINNLDFSACSYVRISTTAAWQADAAIILSASNGNVYVTSGNITTPGIKTDGYYYANGTPVSFGGGSSYSNVQVATYLPTYSGNIANVRLGTSGILTFPDGSQQTTAAFGGGGNYGNANVAAFLPTYTGTTGITQIGTLATLSVTGNATVGNLVGTEANTRIIANTYVTTFDIYGNVSFPANVIATNFVGSGSLLSGVAIKTTGSWTVPTGNSTQSFTVASGTYQLWVDCNIPNGILAWNATATVTNSNVPVVGQQFAWVYNGGGTPIDFTSIPNQFVGTGNTIVRNSTAPSATTNRFDFGISNTSGGNVTVSYGYVKIS